MSTIVIYLTVSVVALLGLLTIVFILAALRWIKLDMHYKRQRMLRDRAEVYVRESERWFKPGSHHAMKEHLRDMIRRPYDVDSAIEAAMYDVQNRQAHEACAEGRKDVNE